MTTVQDIKQRFGIIGSSPALLRAVEKAAMVAATDISVLVTGRSGTGKEIIPKIIHSLSSRKHKPYIAVNCGAIPEGTIESELFGHEKGAFTGAQGVRKGYFEVASGGTIFLDEVGELPLTTQVKLLRVLETGEFLKVGSSAVQKTDVRLVAATNKNLLEAIAKGHFREDLYYRLNTVEIHLPPLSARGGDVCLLFRKFASDFADKYKTPPVKLTPDAIEELESYPWPGNIRQLRNITEQISVFEADKTIDRVKLRSYLPDAYSFGSHLPSHIDRPRQEAYAQLAGQVDELFKEQGELKRAFTTLLTKISQNEGKGVQKQEINIDENGGYVPVAPALILPAHNIGVTGASSLRDKDFEMISRALQKYGSNRKEAASELGISERTLYRKIKQYGL